MSTDSAHENTQFTQNQNNKMSDDPGDGGRKSFVTGRDGAPTAAERAPEGDAQDQSTIEAFGEAFTVYRRALDDGIDQHLRGRSVQPAIRPYA